MKTTKLLSLALVFVLLMGLIAGCTNAPAATTASPSPTPSQTPTATPEPSPSPSPSPTATPDPLSGTITVNMIAGPGIQEAWQAVADAYVAMHPNVKVVIDLKAQDGYSDWIKAVLQNPNPDTDILPLNYTAGVADSRSSFALNMYPYLSQTSPYSGGPWQDQFDFKSQNNVDQFKGEWFNLSLQTVQLAWFYNKDIFDKVGVAPPTTWDEMIDVCQKLDAAGYQPLAVPGDFQSFWALQMGWLAQVYADQVCRDYINVIRAQPGDYCYDPEVDGVWKYDPTDPYNDANSNVTGNPVRFCKAVVDGTLRADSDGYKYIMTELAKVFPKYAGGNAFFGTSNSLPLFYQGKAAMYLDGGWRISSYVNDMKTVKAGGELTGNAVGVDNAVIQDPVFFNMGSFNMPSMTGPLVEAPARTIEIADGNVGAINKDPAHNDLVMDFLMYWSSQEGYGKFLGTGLANGMAVSGPPLVKGVSLPDEYAKLYGDIKLIGNFQGLGSNTVAFSRGAPADVQESLRQWYSYTQDLLNGKIDVNKWAQLHQANIDQWFADSMKVYNISKTDLENPQNAPAGVSK